MLECEEVFNCILCGYYPPSLISDVNKKCVFDISQLEEIERYETNDHVDIDIFWNSVESEILTKGTLVR